MARDSEVRSQMTECLASADIIIVSVGKEDVADFEHTRLYRIVAEQISQARVIFLQMKF